MPLSQIAPLQRGFDLPTDKVSYGVFPVVYSNGILRSHNEYKCVAPGVITGRSGTIGKFTFISSGFYWPHNTSLWVTDFCDNYPLFIYYLYQSINIEQFATGSGVPTLNRNDVHRYKTSIPDYEEQEKIAKFLQLIDERIATQRRLIEDLEKLKSSIANRCYRGDANIQLGDFITQVSNRNKSNHPYKVMSVSNIRGFIPQSEQFVDREIVSENTTSYKIVSEDLFAYNPARINIGSIARYKDNKVGIVSPMYVCFKVGGQMHPQFLEYFFQTHRFKSDVEMRLEGSVRRCLNFDALCEIEIPEFQLSKQVAISSALETINRKITLEEDILSQINKQRKYLLSNMFM